MSQEKKKEKKEEKITLCLICGHQHNDHEEIETEKISEIKITRCLFNNTPSDVM